MFNKDGLGEATEAIVYINLLVALLAVILLYDRNRIDTEDKKAGEQHDRELHDTVEALEARVLFLEDKLNEFMTDGTVKNQRKLLTDCVNNAKIIE